MMISERVKRVALLLALVAAGAAAWSAGPALWAGLGTMDPRQAALAFLAAQAIATLAFVPSVLPASAAGAVFGTALGVPLALLGAAAGATLALLAGRHLLPRSLAGQLDRTPRLRALQRAMQDDGWRVITLARLTPVFPFSVLNYAFGASRISARHYFTAALLGSIPSTAFYVYSGSLAGNAARAGAGESAATAGELLLPGVGVVATLALLRYARRKADAMLASELADPS